MFSLDDQEQLVTLTAVIVAHEDGQACPTIQRIRKRDRKHEGNEGGDSSTHLSRRSGRNSRRESKLVSLHWMGSCRRQGA
jgi:hypothetical protein